MPVEPGTVNAPEFPAGLDWLNTAEPLSIRQLGGKIVLLDFWTYCCINCMHVLGDLKRLEAKYQDELVVVGVHSAKFSAERETGNIRQAILRYGIEHPVVNDHRMQVWQEYAVRAWPTLLLVDPRGKVVGGHSGEGVFDLFDRVIGQLIEQYDREGLIDRRPVEALLEREREPEPLLAFPGKVLADGPGGRLFISDSNHHRVIVTSLEDGSVLEVLGAGEPGLRDGPFGEARFRNPQGLAPAGRYLYIADTDNHAIRRADLESRQVETLAGDGTQSLENDSSPSEAKTRRLNSPWDLELAHGVLFIAMAGPHQIWGLDLEGGIIAGHAGSGAENHLDGPLLGAALAQPSGLATDGQVLFVADSEISSIRTVDLDPRGGNVRTIVGKGLFDYGDVDGIGDEVRLQHPLGVAYHDYFLWVADTYNNKIKQIDPQTSVTAAFAGSGKAGLVDGHAAGAQFDEPGGISAAGGKLYVADTNNHAIRVIDIEAREVSTFELRGLESLRAPAGDVVRLEEQALRPGTAAVKITLDLPAGYRLNDLAPANLTLCLNGAERRIEARSFPVEASLDVPAEGGTLRLDAAVYYCREGREKLCLLHSRSYEKPLRTDSQGPAELNVALKPMPSG